MYNGNVQPGEQAYLGLSGSIRLGRCSRSCAPVAGNMVVKGMEVIATIAISEITCSPR